MRRMSSRGSRWARQCSALDNGCAAVQDPGTGGQRAPAQVGAPGGSHVHATGAAGVDEAAARAAAAAAAAARAYGARACADRRLQLQRAAACARAEAGGLDEAGEREEGRLLAGGVAIALRDGRLAGGLLGGGRVVDEEHRVPQQHVRLRLRSAAGAEASWHCAEACTLSPSARAAPRTTAPAEMQGSAPDMYFTWEMLPATCTGWPIRFFSRQCSPAASAHLSHEAVVPVCQGVGHRATRVPHIRTVAEHLVAHHIGQHLLCSAQCTFALHLAQTLGH